MNERLKELAEQAGLKVESWMTNPPKPFQILGSTEQFEKFAELIVRECAVYCEGHILHKGMAEENDLNYNDGVMDCAIGLKLHFGVE